MKKYKYILFFITFFTQLTYCQNLTANDLISFCSKKNWEEVNQKLVTLGWNFNDSKKNNITEYNTISWSFKKNEFEDKAQGWFYLLTLDNNPEIVIYSIFNKNSYLLLTNSLIKSGFKLVNNSIEDNEINSKYSNLKYELLITTKKITSDDLLSSSKTGYTVTLHRKNNLELKNSDLNVSKSKYFIYKINNECYTEDPNCQSTILIDGKPYIYNEEIKLQPGNHIIKEKLEFKSGTIAGSTFDDEVIINLDKSKFEITISLNCACPFFYYSTLNGNVYGGEIIRNQNSIDKDKLDNVLIDKQYIKNNTLKLIITEEKEEISYLDNLFLEINNSIIINVNSTNSDILKKIIKNDNEYLLLKENDSFEVFFDIPLNIEIKQVKLFSKGYYKTIKK